MRRVLALALLVLAVTAAAPMPAQQAPFFFIQLSDPQFGFFNNDIDFPQETANFEFTVANVNRLKPDFVIITGDLVNKPGDPAQMAEYDRIRKQILPTIPVYEMPGNHDIENAPTPERVAAYRAKYGPDHYVFRHKNVLGIVLNSTVIHTPDKVAAELAAQDAWLKAELVKAKASDAKHIIVFQHHPWFLAKADEDDSYYNVPKVRREPLLALFREAGVKTLVSGHYHQNAVATDAGFEAITTGAVGRPLGQSESGFRIFHVTDTAVTHRYYNLGLIPTSINPARGFGAARGAPPAGGPAPGGAPVGAPGRGPAQGR
jgi:3',5'-cyclic AMP phosphodiesterase CpdA